MGVMRIWRLTRGSGAMSYPPQRGFGRRPAASRSGEAERENKKADDVSSARYTAQDADVAER
jgi:hypothetical protein